MNNKIRNNKIRVYRVADFCFSVRWPWAEDVDTLLPSFRNFRETEPVDDDRLFELSAVSQDEPLPDVPMRLLDETSNDMGLLRLYAVPAGYRIEIAVHGCLHCMEAASDFTWAKAWIRRDNPGVGNVLSSMLRIAFAQAILRREGVSVHAAAVYRQGRAYLFMGKSGTGKSTHASLWLRHLPGSGLLNDDNPALRLVGGKVYAYGTPWSGKTPCYRNASYPVGGIVRLRQAPANRFRLCEGAEAFVALYPGCSVIADDPMLRHSLYDTLAGIAAAVRIGTLDCLPDGEAAMLCCRSLSEHANETSHNNE